MKKIKYSILVFVVLGISAYFLYKNASKEKDPTNIKESVSIPVDSLCLIYLSNEAKANEMYLDKVIDIKGKIAEIENNENRYSLFFKNHDESISISCEMDTIQNHLISKLKKGNEINIKGFCIGMLIDIELNKCKIIENN